MTHSYSEFSGEVASLGSKYSSIKRASAALFYQVVRGLSEIMHQKEAQSNGKAMEWVFLSFSFWNFLDFPINPNVCLIGSNIQMLQFLENVVDCGY